jgi:WxL Interacting Protein, peptidoglycan binding domain
MDRIRYVSIALVCGLFFAIAHVAVAQDVSFGLVPYSIEEKDTLPRLAYSLAAGQSETGAVRVTNQGDEEAYLRLSATDAHTSVRGGVSFPESSENPSAVGAWISLAVSEFRLSPQEQLIVPFTLTVPIDARSGEHRAGILLELADPDTSRPDDAPAEGQIQVIVISRKALNVRVTVPGPEVVGLDIVSVEHVFEGGQSTFYVELHNKGNVPAEMAGGELQVMDASGQVIGALPIQINGEFLAGDTVSYPVRFDEPLPEAQYGVAATVDYGGGAPAMWQSNFEVAKEAVKEAERQAIERGFKLPSQPTSGEVNYWMVAGFGLGLAVLLAVAVYIGMRAAQGRRGT